MEDCTVTMDRANGERVGYSGLEPYLPKEPQSWNLWARTLGLTTGVFGAFLSYS